ncbi:MAG TPA: hydroxyphenylacetyl-CoA thioesterase PaaI [Methylibium sp.]|nr:hydroxyphenylacetyl-CoA thioesterase PaaI [Methylibium sp.]HEU4457760.1 hydroxyphenylacetyl-CoA thioesterase PaaI [Methylibium sp.]
MWQRDAASRALGMRLDEVGPGRAVMTMRVRPDMLNGVGTCHGGILFALADSCFGFACNSRNRTAVAAGCSIDYLAPAREGDLLRAEAAECASAGRNGVYDVRISDEAGTTLAVFRGRCREVGTAVLDAPPAPSR